MNQATTQCRIDTQAPNPTPLSHSLFRQMYLLWMLNLEHKYFMKYSTNGGVKQVLKRLVDSYNNNIPLLKQALHPALIEAIEGLLENEEKMMAMSTIFEKLAALDVTEVQHFEQQFNEIVTIHYQGDADINTLTDTNGNRT